MEQKMTRWGVGPVFAFISIIYFLVSVWISRIVYPFFNLDLLSSSVFKTIGIGLLIVGVPFLLAALVTAYRAYNAGKLVTTGVFRLCRNPIYASWIVFLVPGIVLFQKSWLVLTTPLFMAIILLKLVKTEENYLEKVFGEDYIHYKKRVPSIMPYGMFKGNKS